MLQHGIMLKAEAPDHVDSVAHVGDMEHLVPRMRTRSKTPSSNAVKNLTSCDDVTRVNKALCFAMMRHPLNNMLQAVTVFADQLTGPLW